RRVSCGAFLPCLRRRGGEPMNRRAAPIACLALGGPAAGPQRGDPAPPTPRPPPQQTSPPPPPPQQPTYAYPPAPVYGQPVSRYGMPIGPEQVYRNGRRQRTIGMVLTFVGLGLGALGFALLYDA